MGPEHRDDSGGFPPRQPLDQFGTGGPDPDYPGQRVGTARPQILANQATEWEANLQEVEIVKSRRTGLVLLFLLALLVVAVIALGLAALSVFRDGDDLTPVESGQATTDSTEPGQAADESATTLPTSTVPPAPDPNQLQVVVTEEPFLCDGGTRQFAELSGAAPNEEVAFSSPQSEGLKSGTADANGVLPIRWQCDPEQAGTTWQLTATGVESGKTVTFIFAGATQPAGSTTVVPTELTVNLVENPFVCNSETRIFGGLSGADPNETVAFSSPQASSILPGTADADGALPIRWQCDPEQAGTTWELTATGETSGRTVTFSFVGG
ncbi:MAG: hypothetical protein ACR2QK_21950 [Acidimicrobiales bacterium]